MRNGNKKLILIALLSMLCLLVVYKVTKSYNNEKIVKYDEINLADLGAKTSCATKDYTKCGCYSIPTENYMAREQCFKGCDYCITCNAGSELSNGYCYKSENSNTQTTCKIYWIKEVNGKKTVQAGSSFKISYMLTGTCAGYTVTGRIVNGSGSLQSAASSGYYNAVAGKCGEKTTVTITLRKGSTIVDTSSYTVNVSGPWRTESSCETSPACTSKECSEKEGSRSPGEYYTDPVGGCYTVRHYRGCYVKSNNKACYGNARLLSLATSVKWLPENKLDSVHRIKVEGVTSEKDCVLPKSTSFCEPKSIATSVQEKNASVCEDDKGVTINTSDGFNCNQKPFYKIICDNAITTTFDNGDDGGIITTTNQIYAGQGFKFGIKVTIKRKCTAEFSASNWLEAYRFNEKKLSQINSDLKRKPNASETKALNSALNMYQNKQDDLKDLVKKYNSFDPTKSYSENTSLSLDYRVANKTINVKSNFMATTIQNGDGKYIYNKVVKLGVSGVTNPHNYEWNNYDKPNITKLTPPKTYFGEDGEIANEGIDGGNKIYVNYYAEPGTYTMNVQVSGLGGNNTVNNKKCKLKIVDHEIIYRPIDVTNPFINNQWTPGTNWVNNSFDFRSVIHSDIWNEKE